MRVKILGEHKCEIHTDRATFFQSYDTLVAVKHANKITLAKDWQYSHTTAKHVAQWLNIPAKEIHKRIKEGTIKVVPQILEIEIWRQEHSYAMD